jgi:hypothetical protein
MMVIYFLLIGFAALLVGVEFISDAGAPALREDLLSNFETYQMGGMLESGVFAPLDRLKRKALLVIGIILFVTMIVLCMFIKHITEPLQHMIEVSERISRGDLRRTIRIHSGSELADLGSVINELSSNLQEILLASRGVCVSGNRLLQAARCGAGGGPDGPSPGVALTSEMAAFRRELDLLNDLVDCFNFYTLKERPSSNRS